MFFSFLLAAWAVVLAGCASHSGPPQAQRIAFLRFENLGPEASADWIGRAISVVLDAELANAPDVSVVGSAQLHSLDRTLGVRPISAPGVSAERTQAVVAGANRLVYGDYTVEGGKLRVRMWVENPQSQTMERVFDVSTGADDAIGAATQMARQFSAHVAAFSTKSETALRLFAGSMEAKDLAQAIHLGEEALNADPDFGPAYRTLAELDLQRQDRDGAEAILARGLARPNLTALERARMQLDSSSLESDPGAKQQALANLSKLEPRNVRTLQSLAEVAIVRHDYATAESAYRSATQLEPENAALLNEYAYAATYAGHLDEGLAALKKYHAMRPRDANALDSQGDLNLLENRYRQAEEAYNEARKIDPNFNGNCDLFKAAMTRAMSGDLAGADGLYNEYIAVRTTGHDSNAPLLHSEWLWLTGRRKQGSGEMLAYAHTAEAHGDKGTASRAYAGASLWSLFAGDRATAQDLAQKAAAAGGASPPAAAVIARFLAQPSASPDEWKARADRFVPNPSQAAVRDQMLGFALLLDGRFDAAKEPLQRLYDTTGTAEYEGITVLLAWCDAQTGKLDAAAPLLALTPIPPAGGIDTFMPMWFPRIFELRAKAAQKAGKPDEARQDDALFGKLSGR